MVDRDREGEWVYYHEKSNRVMTRENYKGGKLHGKKTTYYQDNDYDIPYLHIIQKTK